MASAAMMDILQYLVESRDTVQAAIDDPAFRRAIAPSDSTPLIQQIHITADHIICGLVENRLFP